MDACDHEIGLRLILAYVCFPIIFTRMISLENFVTVHKCSHETLTLAKGGLYTVYIDAKNYNSV